MPMPPEPDNAARALALARAALARPGAPLHDLPDRVLLVDVARQRLTIIQEGRPVASYAVSTASAGIGGEEGSNRTPPGWHRVRERIGAGAPSGTIFESRVSTGRVWRGEPDAGDLILTRVLTLDGVEEGVNRGPGRDSLQRYIYIHGTNHEGDLGSPASHGCVRMANADVIDLFGRVAEGDAVIVAEEEAESLAGSRRAFPDPRATGRFHYVGLGGSGMSALAQFQVMSGGRASGSDRAFDRGERATGRALLERLGIVVHPQDGSGVRGDCAAVVVSTAVEAQIPDVAAARAHHLPIVHRSELLARFVAARRSVAVAGTSGKSTVVAMIFEILRATGRRPSVITGGELVALQREGLWGNAFDGGSDLLVVEADESDGSLVHYRPALSLVLNLQRDHKDMAEVAAMFQRLREQTREAFVVGEGESVAALAGGATVFGFGPEADVRAEQVELGADASNFAVRGVRFHLPTPGRHNVENALAAIAACDRLGVPIAEMAAPLAAFPGVARRFQSLGVARGVEVVDDFAHNPAKLTAAITTAQARVPAAAPHGRVLAVYQPHGYGPTRFLRPDLVETFASVLRPTDRLWMLEIYYAGGTATRDFSAQDIVAEIAARGTSAAFAPSRDDLVQRVTGEARPGDLVLILGARDPTLTDLARRILETLGRAGR